MFREDNVEQAIIEQLKEIIINIRNIRAELNVHPSKKSKLIFVTKTNKEYIKE